MIHFNRSLSLQFTIVGAGANGSNFFRGLCHDLRTHLNAHGRSYSPPFYLNPIMLIDGDKVENKNLGNQIFMPDEVGEYKAEALADRYGEHYDLEVLRCTEYVADVEILKTLMPVERRDNSLFMQVLVGMLDNHASRKLLHEYFMSPEVPTILYLDAGVHGVSLDEKGKPRYDTGNGGQIVLGLKVNGVVVLDPVAHVYPEILTDTESSVPGCGVVIQSAPQRSGTNKFAAQIANNVINTLLAEKSILAHRILFDARLCGSRAELVSKDQKELYEQAILHRQVVLV